MDATLQQIINGMFMQSMTINKLQAEIDAARERIKFLEQYEPKDAKS